MIRQPIITVLGHVDHGKTSIADYIRGTTLAEREAGKITQHIGASEIPIDAIKKLCGNLMFKVNFTIPGLLLIDTPGHEAFANLRKRGGSIADLAVLVIDIMQGIQLQTKEAIEILKTFKVPFVIAANKVDLLNSWKSHDKVFIKNLPKQLATAKQHFESRFYTIVGQLSNLGFNSNLYDKVENYQKEVGIVPVSAKTGEGVAELLALLAGLSQKFLQDKLALHSECKGTILEIKEEKGMGTAADVIIYDGTLKVGDYIAIGGIDEVVKTQVKALLKPLPLSEIRDKKSKFRHVEEVQAATGVKIIANDIDKAIAGAPLVSAKTKEKLASAEEKLVEEIQSILIETDESGIILKCDTLGSLEAVSGLLQKHNVPIRSASIGDINKTDITRAKGIAEIDPTNAFVLGFNVKIHDAAEKLAKEYKIPVMINAVIYKLIERYEEEVERKKHEEDLKKLASLAWPAKFKILSGCVFRQSNPAIFGVEILFGKLKPGVRVLNEDLKRVGEVKNIEDKGEKLEELKQGSQAAVSVKGLVIGRSAKEDDVLYVDMSEESFRAWKENKRFLNGGEIEVLKELAEKHRKTNPSWGL